jgi:hypothetical protein
LDQGDTRHEERHCWVSDLYALFRRIDILYNAAALQFDDNAQATTLSQLQQDQEEQAASMSGFGLLLSPLQFDTQASFSVSQQDPD